MHFRSFCTRTFSKILKMQFAQRKLLSTRSFGHIFTDSMTTQITIGNWQTRDGRKARVVCVDAEAGEPIIALLKPSPDRPEAVYTFFPGGQYFDVGENNNDLIAPWVDKPVFDPSTFPKWKWAAMDKDGTWNAFPIHPEKTNRQWICRDKEGFCRIPDPKEPFTGDWKQSLTELPD
jgi:hypothetical protein